MEIKGKRSQAAVEKLLAAKAACEAAGIPVPGQIATQLGEGYEEKDPNELCIVSLPEQAVQPHQEADRTGLLILLDEIPADVRTLVVFPTTEEKSESASGEQG